jgi:hypothetical protein
MNLLQRKKIPMPQRKVASEESKPQIKPEVVEQKPSPDKQRHPVSIKLSEKFKLALIEDIDYFRQVNGKALTKRPTGLPRSKSWEGWGVTSLWQSMIPSEAQTIHEVNSVAAVIAFGGILTQWNDERLVFSLPDGSEYGWHKPTQGGGACWTDRNNVEVEIHLHIPLNKTEPELIITEVG